MTETGKSQIAFMPYAPIRDGFSVGAYEVWPYHAESARRIVNPDVVMQLNRYFGRYFEHRFEFERGGFDQPVEEVYVITPDGFAVGDDAFTGEQVEDVRTIGRIIAFSAAVDLGGVSATDSFQLFIQNFKVDESGNAAWDSRFGSPEEVKFLKPHYMDSSPLKFEKTDMCEALGKAMPLRTRKEVRRIFRAVDLFCHASFRRDTQSDEFRLLNLAMCFETLLGFKNSRDFVKKLEKLVKIENPNEEKRKIKVRKGSKNVTTEVSMPRTLWWAHDLYELRTDIVHCRRFEWDEQKYGDIDTRMQFGTVLIRKIVKSLLADEKVWKTDMAHSITDSILDPDNLDEILEKLTDEYRKSHDS